VTHRDPPIATAIHRLAEAVAATDRAVTAGRRPPLTGPAAAILELTSMVLPRMAQLPLYVLAEELLPLLDDGGVQRTVTAAFTLGLARLPFPQTVVEMWSGPSAGGTRSWAYLDQGEETPTVIDIVVVTADVRRLSLGPVVTCRAEWLAPGTRVGPDVAVTSLYGEGVRPTPESGIVVGEEGSWQLSYRAAAGHTERETAELLEMMLCGVHLVLVTGHVAELDRTQVPAPAALNRRRVAAGRAPVPPHVTVRIGRVVTADGTTSATAEARRMPVHLRAGHVRRQRHAPGGEWAVANPDSPHLLDAHHPVWIPPVLVNYETGEAPTRPTVHYVRR